MAAPAKFQNVAGNNHAPHGIKRKYEHPALEPIAEVYHKKLIVLRGFPGTLFIALHALLVPLSDTYGL